MRSATNGQPIPGAQVAIPELNVGILANNVGRYLLPNVPAGTHTVEVQYIGYSAVSAEVTVTVGQAAIQDFDLRSEAISLEGVVVTGTAGAARRREIGNSISQLNEEAFQSAPIQNVADILQGRALGVTVLTNGGQVGAGSTIKLRGNNSVSFSNSPLVYVDGVRIRERGLDPLATRPTSRPTPSTTSIRPTSSGSRRSRAPRRRPCTGPRPPVE